MNGDQFRCVETSATGNATTSAGTLVVETPLTVATLAGLAGTNGSTDGSGSVARFAGLSDVAVDSTGNLYVADTGNHTVRKISPTGIVTTLAGRAGVSGSSDGAGSATFNRPTGVAVDAGGNVYVADTNNNEIRKVTAAGIVSTLAGLAGVSGGNDGTGSAASFNGPSGIVADATGNLYVADTLNHTIREVTPSGVVTTIAGLAGVSGFVDATGSAARFHGPQGLALDAAGSLYVADTNNNAVRKVVTSNGAVATLAGQAGVVGNADGTNSQAQFYYPSGIAVDATGNLYVVDTDNHTLRQITPLGAVSTPAGLAGSSGVADGVGSLARFDFPTGVAVDGAGDVYIADTNNETVRVAFTPVAPVITQQPQSQTVNAGGSVQFSVIATGRPAVTYQWYLGSTAINGATSSTYSLSDAQLANAGGYSVVVANSAGSTTSNTANLTVSQPTPTTTIPQGGSGGGGAPSDWFCGALAVLGLARLAVRKRWCG
jgi:sugar lactone lactonase YvrE